MKLLFLAAYCYPENAASLYLSENVWSALGEAGVSMELYTPMPTRGVSSEVRKGYKKK